jgi:hypothetical protein
MIRAIRDLSRFRLTSEQVPIAAIAMLICLGPVDPYTNIVCHQCCATTSARCE